MDNVFYDTLANSWWDDDIGEFGTPASTSDASKAHAESSRLDITCLTWNGERLRLPGSTFDDVARCDALEHVADTNQVVHECRPIPPARTGSLTLCPTPLHRYRTIGFGEEDERPQDSVIQSSTQIRGRFQSPLALAKPSGHR